MMMNLFILLDQFENALQRIRFFKAILEGGVCGEGFVIDLGDEVDQGSIGGDFRAVHFRHGGGERCADRIGGLMCHGFGGFFRGRNSFTARIMICGNGFVL